MKYRFLKEGETIKRGDECKFEAFGKMSWEKTYREGQKVFTSGNYRRPIKKKKGSK